MLAIIQDYEKYDYGIGQTGNRLIEIEIGQKKKIRLLNLDRKQVTRYNLVDTSTAIWLAPKAAIVQVAVARLTVRLAYQRSEKTQTCADSGAS